MEHCHREGNLISMSAPQIIPAGDAKPPSLHQ
jgi:hypothetical protein